MSDIPAPLVDAEVDLRDFDGFMLNVERLLGSALNHRIEALGLYAVSDALLAVLDANDGDRVDADDFGLDLADVQQARIEAIGVLPDIARDVLPDGDRRDFVATARDESGHKLFRATLSLRAEWLN